MNSVAPMISIIIPSFNRADLLGETLEAILRQDYANWEAIIVDDGSTDRNEEIAKEFTRRDERIRFIKRDKNPGGAPVCRNIGIQNAKGSFLIFLDSDDLLLPFTLSQRAKKIQEEPDFDFWVFPMLTFRNNPEDARFLWSIDTGEPDLLRFLKLDAPWQTTGPVWTKEAVSLIGGYTEGLACWQDVDFHLKALISGLKGKKYYSLEPDVLYRQHDTQSISQGEISSPEKLKSRQQIFFSHARSLMSVMNAETKNHLQILGGNIAIGAAKTLNTGICFSVISFGLNNKIFSTSTALRLRMIAVFYLLRLNRVTIFGRQLDRLTNNFRQDSNIGKHLYLKDPKK